MHLHTQIHASSRRPHGIDVHCGGHALPRLQQTSSRLVVHFNRREDGTGGTGGGPTQKAALVEQLGDSHTVPCALPQMKRRLVARTFHDKEPTTQAAHDLTESPLLQMCQGFGANNLSAMDGLPVQACCLRCRGIVRGEGCQDSRIARDVLVPTEPVGLDTVATQQELGLVGSCDTYLGSGDLLPRIPCEASLLPSPLHVSTTQHQLTSDTAHKLGARARPTPGWHQGLHGTRTHRQPFCTPSRGGAQQHHADNWTGRFITMVSSNCQ